MKKLFTLIAICFAISGSSFSQCVPDTSITHNIPGIYPDSATGLPHAYVGLSYLADIQVRVLTDTTYMGFPATIDSIKINSVSGLPAGFTYSCSPANCVFPGGSDACIQLTGAAPTSGMMGVYPLTVNMAIYGRAFGIPQTVLDTNDSYIIYIENNVGIAPITNLSFTVGQNTPNPASVTTLIPVNVPRNVVVHFSISNLLGKQITSHDVNLQKGGNNIPVNLQSLQPGIYLYNITYGGNSVTRRMIVSEN